MNTEFIKVLGGRERNDRLIEISGSEYLLIYGCQTDGSQWRKYYGHRPTAAELKADITALVNAEAERRITGGFTLDDGTRVYLPLEMQLNFLAARLDGTALTMKIGEKPDGSPTYRTFTGAAQLDDFRSLVRRHIQSVREWAWAEKDGIDYGTLLTPQQ